MAELTEARDYKNENGGLYTVRQVTEDGDLLTYGGQRLVVKEGDYVASTGRPDEYVVLSEGLDGLSRLDGPPAEDDSVKEPLKPGSFDPSEHSAVEVREYLIANAHDKEEYERVFRAEESGKNRSSALPN